MDHFPNINLILLLFFPCNSSSGETRGEKTVYLFLLSLSLGVLYRVLQTFFLPFSLNLFFFLFVRWPRSSVVHSLGHRFSHLRTYVRTQILDDPDYSLVKALQTAQQNFVITDASLPDNPIVFASGGFLEVRIYGIVLQKKRVTTAVDVKSERPTIRNWRGVSVLSYLSPAVETPPDFR